MARTKGALSATRGMSDKEVSEWNKQHYNYFCKYRHELSSKMPDFRINVFTKRIFDGLYFTQH